MVMHAAGDEKGIVTLTGFTPNLGKLSMAALRNVNGLASWRHAENWTHPGKVEAPYTVCIASASNLTGLVKSSVECRRTGL